MTYAYTPTTCKSKHWNPGDDICADCGYPLQYGLGEAEFEAMTPGEQAVWNDPDHVIDWSEVEEPILRSPLGTWIDRTLEVTPGACGITVEADGSWDLDGAGNQHDYDNQLHVTRAGHKVFLDGDGNEWLECELVKPGQPLPAIYVSPWDDQATIREFLQEKFDEAMLVIMADKAKDGGGVTPDVAIQITNTLDALAAWAAHVRKSN